MQIVGFGLGNPLEPGRLQPVFVGWLVGWLLTLVLVINSVINPVVNNLQQQEEEETRKPYQFATYLLSSF
jgi:hypothetical protein